MHICEVMFCWGCVSKLQILEPCQSSLAYQPPNPWTMGILGLLAEIYALPNLKMNLKFDIEVKKTAFPLLLRNSFVGLTTAQGQRLVGFRV